jgi:OFA family oxalate/formate antiporter-like MFS transporter
MKNRWVVALAGVLVMVCLGTVYSWSLFTQPLLASFGWSNTTTTWAFALANLFLGIGAAVGGRWQDVSGPRFVLLAAVVMWGAGNILAGLGTPQFGPLWLYATYGVLGGLGLGFGYIACVSAVIKWFPDARGFGGGLIIMGFGLGSYIYNNALKYMPTFTDVAKAAGVYAKAKADALAAHVAFDHYRYALAPSQVHDLMTIFVLSGIAIIIVGLACAVFVDNPPALYIRPGRAAAATLATRPFTTEEMLTTGQFYMQWLMLFLNVSCGILLISNAVPIIQELSKAPAAAAAAAYAMVAIANGGGRIVWGTLSDYIGRNAAFVFIFGLQVAVYFTLGHLTDITFIAASYFIVLLSYGGGFGVMPAFNADYFGTKHFGANYGLVLTAWGCAGLLGPLFISAVKDATGSFSGAIVPAAILPIVAMIIPFIIRKPEETAAPATLPAAQ